MHWYIGILLLLNDEMVHVTTIPRCYDHELALTAELEAYKFIADDKFALSLGDQTSLWDFFIQPTEGRLELRCKTASVSTAGTYLHSILV